MRELIEAIRGRDLVKLYYARARNSLTLFHNQRYAVTTVVSRDEKNLSLAAVYRSSTAATYRMTSKDPSIDVARRRADEPSPTRLLRDGESAAHSASSDPERSHVYRIDESNKLGIRSSIFLILNKMIGTGSQFILL